MRGGRGGGAAPWLFVRAVRWCDAGAGLVHCSAEGHIAWADYEGDTENPDGDNKAWTWCHNVYNQNSSTQAAAEADPSLPNRCRAAPNGGGVGSGTYARIQADGTTLRAKLWQADVQSEPTFWNMPRPFHGHTTYLDDYTKKQGGYLFRLPEFALVRPPS